MKAAQRSLRENYRTCFLILDRGRDLQRQAHNQMLAAVPESEEYWAANREFCACALLIDQTIAVLKTFEEHIR